MAGGFGTTRFRSLSWLPVAGLLIACGCNQQNAASSVAAANSDNVRRVANLYQAFQSLHGWQGPRDEAEFRTFIQQYPAHRLEMMQVDANDLESLLKSERDGQPFVIRYGVKGSLGAVTAVVFEQQGAAGKRQVGFTDGSVEDVDEARYQTLLNDAGRPNDLSNDPAAAAGQGGA